MEFYTKFWVKQVIFSSTKGTNEITDFFFNILTQIFSSKINKTKTVTRINV